jgi:hypothetical protein
MGFLGHFGPFYPYQLYFTTNFRVMQGFFCEKVKIFLGGAGVLGDLGRFGDVWGDFGRFGGFGGRLAGFGGQLDIRSCN